MKVTQRRYSETVYNKQTEAKIQSPAKVLEALTRINHAEAQSVKPAEALTVTEKAKEFKTDVVKFEALKAVVGRKRQTERLSKTKSQPITQNSNSQVNQSNLNQTSFIKLAA